MHSQAAHHALLIDEIARNIFSHADSRTLAQTARVARWLQPASLDMLWFALTSTRPLIYLQKMYGFEEHHLTVAEKANKETRVSFYTKRVYVVSETDQDPKMDNALHSGMLPNLKRIVCYAHTSVSLQILRPLCDTQKLQDLQVTWSESSVNQSVIELFNTLPAKGNLRALKLNHHPGVKQGGWWLKSPTQVVRAMATMLSSMKELTSLALTFNLLSIPVMRLIATVCPLTSLTLTLYFPTHRHIMDSVHSLSGEPMFPYLRQLTMDSSVASANMLLRCIKSTAMTKVDICTQVLDKASELEASFQILSSWTLLIEVSFTIARNHNFSSMALNPQLHRILEENGPAEYVLPGRLWDLLKMCKMLKIVRYTSIVPPEIDDRVIARMTDTWPLLEELVMTPLPISISGKKYRSGVTQACFPILSARCTNLRHLEIDLTVAAPTTEKVNHNSTLSQLECENNKDREIGNPTRRCQLRYLHVGWSPWRETSITPEDVGRILTNTFPKLTQLNWDGEFDLPIGKEKEGTKETRVRWESVINHLNLHSRYASNTTLNGETHKKVLEYDRDQKNA